MTSQEARQLLAIYRPGIDDPEDPEVAEALRAVRADQQLAAWLDDQADAFHHLRSRLRQIEVPVDGMEKTLAGWRARPSRLRIFRPSLRWSLAAAAAVMLLAALGLMALSRHGTRSQQNQFASYRSRMVRTAMEPYRMDYMTNDLRQIEAYLAGVGQEGYVLPPALQRLPGDGCARLRWHNRPVTLICFKLSGREDLYLFIINRLDLADAPGGNAPEFVKLGKFATAAWTEGANTYLLAGAGDEAFLRQFH
jgi:hypothetical protein